MESRISVSSEHPYIVLRCEGDADWMSEGDPEYAIGRSMLDFTGPRTDLLLLQASIERPQRCKAQATQFILYDRDEKEMSMMVSFSHDESNNGLEICRIRIANSPAITLQAALEERKTPYALMIAKHPYPVTVVNDHFSAKYGCAREQMIGKALWSIISCKPDPLRLTICRVAAVGRTARLQVPISHAADGIEELTCIPVVGAPNSAVSYVLAIFAESCRRGTQTRPQRSTTGPENDVTIEPICSASTDAESPSQGASFASVVTDNTAPAVAVHSTSPPDAAAPSRAVLIARPRGRTHAARRSRARGACLLDAAPVAVTTEDLESLRGISLRQAARAVGVSVTAFKRACRRLGIVRWEYKRGPGRRSQAAEARGRALKAEIETWRWRQGRKAGGECGACGGQEGCDGSKGRVAEAEAW